MNKPDNANITEDPYLDSGIPEKIAINQARIAFAWYIPAGYYLRQG